MENLKIKPSQIVSNSYVYHHFNRLRADVKKRPAFILDGSELDTVIISYAEYAELMTFKAQQGGN